MTTLKSFLVFSDVKWNRVFVNVESTNKLTLRATKSFQEKSTVYFQDFMVTSSRLFVKKNLYTFVLQKEEWCYHKILEINS